MKNLHLKVDQDIDLRIPKMEDAQIIFDLVDLNRVYLMSYMEWESKTNSVEDIVAYLNRNKHLSYYDNDFPLVILYKNKIVGITGFNKGNATEKKVEIGYWISKEFTGKGIVTKCCQALINFAFSMTDIKDIYIKCEVTNGKSMAIPIRLGFEFIEQVKGGCFYKFGDAEMVSYKLSKS